MHLTFYFAYVVEADTHDQRIDSVDIIYYITCDLTKRKGWPGHSKEHEDPRELNDFLKEILQRLDER